MEREGEKHQCVAASRAPDVGTQPETQACAPTGNQTGDPLVCRLALNPLSHASPGPLLSLFFTVIEYNMHTEKYIS